MTEMSVAPIKIDLEFQHCLEPLHPCSKEELEALIKEAGKAHDPLIVWGETGILVDGHHRYEICTRLNLPFTVEHLSFPDRFAVLKFIGRHQAGRRNASENWQAYQRGVRYREERQAHGAPVGNDNAKKQRDNESQKPCPFEKTADTIAKDAGVHANTIKNDATFAAAVDTLVADGAPKSRVMGQKKAAVVKAAKLPEPQRVAVAAALQTEKRIKTAERKVREAREAEAAKTAEQVQVVEAALASEEPPVVEIAGHLLLLGDNADPEIRARLPERVTLAFCDPPYNATEEEWDGTHEWHQDYLADIADVVAVTPGISAIHDFMSRTAMPYRWSTACFIDNGMARGELGFGNWMYTALFSKQKSLHRNRQDVGKISIKSSDKYEDHQLGAKRQKPPGYLAWLFGLLTQDGDTILDPFVGSGTSVIVAHKLGRRCIGIEKEPATYQGMVRRVRAAVAGDVA